MINLVLEFAERLRAAMRETRLAAVGDLRAFFRQPYGRGWAFVGDADYRKDPITAFGITDALRDAEAAAAALDDAFAGRRSYDEAMASWQHARDEQSLPAYGFTCDVAKIEPPPSEMLTLLGAVSRPGSSATRRRGQEPARFRSSHYFPTSAFSRLAIASVLAALAGGDPDAWARSSMK